MADPDACAFCRIAADTSAVVLLHDDGDLIVFLDHMPIRPGHCMIVPRGHYPYFDDMPFDLAARAMGLAQRLARAMKSAYDVERVAFFATGTDVAHAHLHLVPMHEKTDLTSARYMAETPVFRRLNVEESEALAVEAARLGAALEVTK
jgi:histidine triad (HIT) family protein